MIAIDRPFITDLEARLALDLNAIQVIIGPRQVGKTTGLKTIVSRWKGPSHMVTADETASPSAYWLELQWELAKKKGPNVLLVIDEIQKIKDWSRVIKVLFDRERDKRTMKVVLLGSASLGIQQGLSESLTGRYEQMYVPHWTYPECQKAFGWDLETYITFGGYPAAAELISDIKRWQDYIKYGIIEPVLSKDILLITSIHKPALFRQCFELAMAYPSQEIALTKLLGQLQDKGNVTTIKHYLLLLEGAFLVKSLQKYSGSKLRARLSTPKLVPLNNALPSALHGKASEDSVWQGRLFESAIGTQLTLMDGELFYFREGDYEVDYIFKTTTALYAIEVKSERKKGRYMGLERFIHAHPNAIPVIIDKTNAEAFFQGASLESL